MFANNPSLKNMIEKKMKLALLKSILDQIEALLNLPEAKRQEVLLELRRQVETGDIPDYFGASGVPLVK